MSAFVLGHEGACERHRTEGRVLRGLVRAFSFALPLDVRGRLLDGRAPGARGCARQQRARRPAADPARRLDRPAGASCSRSRQRSPSPSGCARPPMSDLACAPPRRRRWSASPQLRCSPPGAPCTPGSSAATCTTRARSSRRLLPAARRHARARGRPARRDRPRADREAARSCTAAEAECVRARPHRRRRHGGPVARRSCDRRARRQRRGRRPGRLPRRRAAPALRRPGDQRQDHAQSLRRQRPDRQDVRSLEPRRRTCAPRKHRARSRRGFATTRSSRS